MLIKRGFKVYGGLFIRSRHSKQEKTEAAMRPRYLEANKGGKEQIMDELVATSGYHHKVAIWVLLHSVKQKGLKQLVVCQGSILG